jgi:hypothetical protein
MDSIIFSSSGSSASAIADGEYLKKGNIFSNSTIFNGDILDNSTTPEIVLKFKFLKKGIYTFQYLATLNPQQGSISKLSLVDNSSSLEKTVLQVKGETSYLVSQSVSVNSIDQSFSWRLNSLLGKTQECRISNLEIFYSSYGIKE